MGGRPEANSGFGRSWGLWGGKYRILRGFGRRIRRGKRRCGAENVLTPTRGGGQEALDGAPRGLERRGGRRAATCRPRPLWLRLAGRPRGACLGARAVR